MPSSSLFESGLPETPRVLVVIDMQPDGFPLARSVLRQVMQAIAHAMASSWLVLIVEFDIECAGSTDPAIMSMLAGYPRWKLVKKSAEDGSLEVIEAVTEAGMSTVRPFPGFRMAGVTTDDCISKTAHGLARRLPDCSVEVIKDACFNWQGSRFDWSRFSRAANIVLI
ncbi:MAG: hypothetical protein AB7W16_06820 [Candidatus Obscuribacterales bacterium]